MQDPAEVRDWPLESGGCRLRNAAQPGEHHRPRGTEGAHSVRVSRMWNVEPRPGPAVSVGRPTVREAESLGGNRMTREANAGTPKGDGKGITGSGRLLVVGCRTGRIRAVCPARKGAHAGQVSLWR